MEIVDCGIPAAPELREGVDALFRAVFEGESEVCFIHSEGEYKRLFVARIDGEVVGFKFSAEKRPGLFHSRMGAVASTHRKQGIARALLDAQHTWARREASIRSIPRRSTSSGPG